MVRIRYMIVDHPASVDGKLAVANRKFINVPPIHQYAPIHHWVRLDGATIFVKATYPNKYHDILMHMPGVTILPATFSRKTVAAAIGDQHTPHHEGVLQGSKIPYDATTVTSDIVDWMAEHVNGIFDHEF